MGLKGAAGCSLPHVIRANQQRVGIAKAKPQAVAAPAAETSQAPAQHSTGQTAASGKRKVDSEVDMSPDQKKRRLSPDEEETNGANASVDPSYAGPPEDSNEFISLTFLESDEEDDDDDDEVEAEDEDEENDSGGDESELDEEDPAIEDDENDENEVTGELLPSDDAEMHSSLMEYLL